MHQESVPYLIILFFLVAFLLDIILSTVMTNQRSITFEGNQKATSSLTKKAFCAFKYFEATIAREAN